MLRRLAREAEVLLSAVECGSNAAMVEGECGSGNEDRLLALAKAGTLEQSLRRFRQAGKTFSTAGTVLLQGLSSSHFLVALPPAFLAGVSACLDDDAEPRELGCLDVQRIVTERNGHGLHGDSWSPVRTGVSEELTESICACRSGKADAEGEKYIEQDWRVSLRNQPGLNFKIGIAAGLALMKMEGDAAVSRRAIVKRLTSIGPVHAIAARAVLLASGGGDLHIAAAICDLEALQAALEFTDKCSCGCLDQVDSQTFKAGDRVILAEWYENISDAGGGPFSPGDIGLVTEVRYDNGDRVHVDWHGRTWWYKPEALLRSAEETCACNRCNCIVNCINSRDLNGRTALHMASFTFSDHKSLRVLMALIDRGARLHSRADDASTPLHYLLKSPAALASSKPPIAFLRAIDALSSEAVYQKEEEAVSPITCALCSEAPNAKYAFERMLWRVQQLENEDVAEGEKLAKLVWQRVGELMHDDDDRPTILECCLKRLGSSSCVQHRQEVSRLLSASMVQEMLHNSTHFCSPNHEIADMAQACGTAVPMDVAIACMGFAWNDNTIQKQQWALVATAL